MNNVYVRCGSSLRAEEKYSSTFLNMNCQAMLAPVQFIKTRGPQLTANCNSGERGAACPQAKRPE